MRPRPLSPHLQVYRMTLSMLMSILHRLTGLGLVAGVIGFVTWLYIAAFCATWFIWVQALFSSWIGQSVLIGITWAFFHHLLGGLRHFLWDTGLGFKLHHVELLARVNLVGSIVLTAAVWLYFGVFV